MEFYCKECNYKTNDKSNFLKHSRTDKHKKNVKTQNTCVKVVAPSTSIELISTKLMCEWCNRYY